MISEDFASDIELTEEEQIKLLEQYENEKKNEKENSKIKKPIGEKIIFKQESSKKNIGKNNEKKNVERTSILNKKESAVSVDTPSSNSSTDGDWEKITDIEK